MSIPHFQPIGTDPALPPGIDRDGFGFSDALARAQQVLDETRRVLLQHQQSGAPSTDKPIYFDSNSMCVTAYLSAIERVTKRYWTTTYLSSGFWSNVDMNILDINIRLMTACKRSGVEVRRLFLLQIPADEEIQRLIDERRVLQKCDDREGLACFDRRLLNLSQNIRTLIQHGCDVRIVHDQEELHRRLPAELCFDPGDSEIAVYDGWRFDLFQGGRSGIIENICGFTPAIVGFLHYREAVVDYFEKLWIQARSIDVFFGRLQKAIDDSSRHINYRMSWLAEYDHALPREDEFLKVSELNSVRVELMRLNRQDNIGRYLDVGTCTGRYPIALRDMVRADGEIVGIDKDIDCVQFTQTNIRRECSEDFRFRIMRHDFCAPEFPSENRFDLITCMMGTLSHFDHEDRSEPYEDMLQYALEKFARLLAPGGILFFSVWSREACQELRLLSIYSDADKQQLARSAISREALQQRLEAVGFRVARPLLLDRRMDLYRCQLPFVRNNHEMRHIL
jgi:SAM-dependent methyltransferase